jgi:superfamily II DNA or RNA helicase
MQRLSRAAGRHRAAACLVPLTELHLRAARARIASVLTASGVSPVLGSIRLREDQRASASRVLAALDHDGGCLLADDVGTGKTYVALAVARTWSRPLLVVPASIRSTWHDAMTRAGVRSEVISHEALSRGRIPDGSFDGIVVDESHRFRSTTARRHAALATLCAHARLLLLSATPLQNRSRDLAAQIALFHGARAFRLAPDALARFVVRSGADTDYALPSVAPPVWVALAADDACVLQQILALPSPTAPADGGDAGALRMIGLVRAWASSRAALDGTLRRRRQVATAIEQCLAEGLLPTRAELDAWRGADTVVQLGFAPLLASGAVPADHGVSLADVEREQEALAHLSRAVSSGPDPDEARAAALREICAAHPNERVIAFTEFASTARSYYAHLARQPGVGLLTAREARIASGRLSRDALLARFAPCARHAPPPRSHERVTLLITTDLLSEGVNLQDASVVAHLDLPWNPARLAQRVGRVRRPGGARVVHTYLMAPPASSELLLDMEQRLRRKLESSTSAIGRGFDVVPRLARTLAPSTAPDRGTATLHGETLSLIARWRRPLRHGARSSRPIAAAVDAARPGWLAALSDGRLVTAPSDSPGAEQVTLAVRSCGGPARPLRSGESARCLLECQRIVDAERLTRMCGREEEPSELSTAVDRRIAEALRRAPRHQRAEIAVLGQRLRSEMREPRSLGVERALQRILDRRGDSDHSGWLRAAHALIARDQPRTTRDADPAIVALIVLGTGD